VRVRVRYAKRGKVRFTSHRDTARIWERATRRAGLPVTTSAGFTPRLRLSFGLALPTGAESIAEYLDVDVLDGALSGEEIEALPSRLDPVLPVGFRASRAVERDAEDASSLQESVTSVTWELGAPPGSDLDAAVDRVLGASELPLERERKGERRVDDVRPAITSLAVAGDDTLVAELATVGRGLRPAELVAVAFPGADVRGLRVLRTHQWIEHDGDRREVLSLPVVVSAPEAGA
jgi:radical SAM-linked protein